ncbi:hypothetical protein SDC9_127047 [bioreactor metagenome]|uniref:Uncharacterized protein n=1 Tax=bioreactor metagenome TaxID=1076179 RepID=A0A645CSX8_9ZZZZ
MQQGLADAGRAALVNNMGKVLIAEVAHGGQDRVRGGLAEGAQRVVLDVEAELLKLVKVL